MVLVVSMVAIAGTPTLGTVDSAQPTPNRKFDRLYAAAPDVSNHPTPDAISLLTSGVANDRLQAFEALHVSRELVSRGLRQEIEKLAALAESTGESPDRDCIGKLSFLLAAIRVHRVEDTIPSLFKLLEFTIDPNTLPFGAKYQEAVYFPVAHTLTCLGGPKMFDSLTASLDQSASDRRLRLSTWILKKSLGIDGATGYVEGVLRSSGPTKLQKQNFNRVLDLLNNHKAGILPDHRG
jgi:hypothetical protein